MQQLLLPQSPHVVAVTWRRPTQGYSELQGPVCHGVSGASPVFAAARQQKQWQHRNDRRGGVAAPGVGQDVASPRTLYGSECMRTRAAFPRAYVIANSGAAHVKIAANGSAAAAIAGGLSAFAEAPARLG